MPKGIYKRGVINRKRHSDETKLKLSLVSIGKPKSESHRNNIKLSKIGVRYPNRKRYLKGELHFNWKGGKTSSNQLIRTSLEYKLWRKSVYERDNYTCVWCKAKSVIGRKVLLNADHIKPFSLFPELRFNIDNGRTLCLDCHKKTDTFGGKCTRLTQL